MEIDDESKHELMEGFSDLYAEIEQVLNSVSASQCGAGQLNQLFRAIHSIKGNAAMMQLGCLVEFTHVIEDVAESLRSNVYALSEPICESILLGIDRLRDLHNRELWGHKFSDLHEQTLTTMYADLASANKEQCDERALAILDFMSAGASPASNDRSLKDGSLEDGVQLDADSPETVNHSYAQSNLQEIPNLGTPERVQADLSYFQQLSFMIDSQNPYWLDRSAQLFDWAHKMNQLAGDIVNQNQLSVAIYLHDLGMIFIPNSILNTGGKLNESEIRTLRQHPTLGFNFLARTQGWEEAAAIILEHHEWVDGSGYPRGIKREAIHPGACILAILDAFFSIVRGRADRAARKPIVRAISEINAQKGCQFDDFWVACFNDMIKAESKKGAF